MANRYEITHRFANKDWGKNGTLTAGNVSCGTRNYYSYSTVFGQWVDFEKNVCLIYQGSTSVSSSKHQLYKGLFPEDVHVFPYDDGGSSGWHRWHGCNLISYGEFDWHARKTLLNYWIGEMYEQFLSIKVEKKKGLEAINYKWWSYVEELCSLYRDTSVSKWLRAKRIVLSKDDKRFWAEKRKMVRLLANGERDVKTITDEMFGEGTFQRYWDYCAKYRKQAKKKAQMEWLCNRLHIRYPYGRDWSSERIGYGMTAMQIRSLTAKQRNEIHFAALAKIEENKNEVERKEKRKKNFRNAYKWIVGVEPMKKQFYGYDDCVDECINKDTGEVYELRRQTLFYCFDWSATIVRFDYNDYRKSDNKEQWIENFYKRCEYAERLQKACGIFESININYEDGKYGRKRFVDNNYLRENTSSEAYELCKWYIEKQDQLYANEEAERRAAELRRKREEEERERERAFKEAIKKQQIDECISQGAEGCRNLWRNHFMETYEAEHKFNEAATNENFYYGGNILMRLSLNKEIVETSMRIRINIPTCKRMWKLVKVWHEDPSKFRQLEIKTLSGTYTIISYKDDILTAGCHKIAYAEMEHVYNTIIENEKTA